MTPAAHVEMQAEHRKAVLRAHLSGLLRHHTLTPEGVQAVRLALSRVVYPPGSIGGAA